jgi:sugar phosphate isomerase/epimerase
VACLDIGHAPLVGVDPCELIRALGRDRLKALHVHDVDGINDLHTLPYLSKINWDSVCAALKEIGYEGDLTFEAGNFVTPLPTELSAAAAKFMVAAGRHLIDKIRN